MTTPMIGKASLCNILPLVQNLAAGWAVQTAQQGKQCCLTAPGGAKDGIHFTLL